MFSEFLIITIIAVALCNGAVVIESPRITNWGTWTSWSRCPTDWYVMGMRLKVEEKLGIGDDTALNGIKLFCATLDDPLTTKEISVYRRDGWGDWLSTRRCPNSVANGFELRSESPQGAGDDTAANNLRLYCNQDITPPYIEGDGQSWGDWTGPQKCPEGHAICGIQAQIEKPHDSDKTALNNVNMECCLIKSPVGNCVANDQWMPLQNCQNYLTTSDFVCKFAVKVGISTQKTTTKGSSVEHTASISLSASLTAGIGDKLSAQFSTTLGYSLKTGYNWQQSESETWNTETTRNLEITVKPGKKVSIEQVVGSCGAFRVGAPEYRVVEH